MMGVEVCSDTDRSRVVLIGELDLASAPHLQRVLDELHRDGFQEIVLDLARLDFLSATGLEVFVHTDDQLRATGGRLILSQPGPRARRILAITDQVSELAGIRVVRFCCREFQWSQPISCPFRLQAGGQ
jgi:anti-anti-sigma factor